MCAILEAAYLGDLKGEDGKLKADASSDGNDLAALNVVANEILGSFSSISEAARADLSRRGMDLGDLAMVNQATAEATARQMREINDQRIGDSQRLRREPAIARLVIADENDNRETLYISSGGTVEQGTVRLCSYMSPKGRLASLAIGDFRQIPLPGGPTSFEVIEKITFKPVDLKSEWDAQPAVQFRDKRPPLTVKSLRELLREDGFEGEVADEIEAWLAGGDSAEGEGNVSEGIKRDALTAMQLRVAPILNEFQDRIFRLPIDSQIAVLGPPGTGKTTTLVKRLRQKVDFAYLDPEHELPLVRELDEAGLTHADSWLMFTPTELLRLYVKDAFGKAGVPVHDERVRTWDDYRREVGRRTLRVLGTRKGSGLVLNYDDTILSPGALTDQIGLFEAFDAHQQHAFVVQLTQEADRLAKSSDEKAAALGRQIGEVIVRSGSKPLQLLSELAALWDRLNSIVEARREATRVALRAPLRALNREKPGFLDALTRFAETLGEDRNEELDEDEAESEEDEAADRRPTLRGARLAEEVFVKAMRARAVAQASGRAPAAASRAGRLLAWIREQGLDLPDFEQVGAALLLQRAARRLSRAPRDYLEQIPARYRRFRRAMREKGKWYGAAKVGALDAHPAEIDVIMLAVLRTARAMERDRLLTQRLADRKVSLIEDIASLRRDQVLVDEATDFSPVQLACMRALANPRTESFFLSGDFNQRLTRWGSRSEEELRWVASGMQIESIDISYRQSRKLADFARTLGGLNGYEVNDRPPEHIENQGWEPVVGYSLRSVDDQARWLSDRIREIDHLTDGILPTIAILVADAGALEPLAEALSKALADMNIRAVACPKGMVKGQAGDVRIFEVEHIKGLEFEAVFFMDVDILELREPELFDRYIYVGATRAATFLGLGCREAALPSRIEELEPLLLNAW